MNVSVILPTWKRYELIKKTLTSLREQTVTPFEVVYIYRDIDKKSYDVAKKFIGHLNLVFVEAKESGVVHAENLGMNACSGDIICFIDDDAQAPTNWIEKILNIYRESEDIIGVGGPDNIVHHHDKNYRKKTNEIGKINFLGMIKGNHHHISDGPIEVQILKGVNMSFKRDVLLYLDKNLCTEHSKGNGSHWELDLCLQIKKKNLKKKFIFSPELDVTHESNHSHFIEDINLENNSRNMTYVLLKNLNIFSKMLFVIYMVIVGNTQVIGGGKFIQLIFQIGVVKALKMYKISLKGQALGVILFFKNIGVDLNKSIDNSVP